MGAAVSSGAKFDKASVQALAGDRWISGRHDLLFQSESSTISRSQLVDEMRAQGYAIKRLLFESDECIYCALKRKRGQLESIVAVSSQGFAVLPPNLTLPPNDNPVSLLPATVTVIRPPSERLRITCTFLASAHHLLYTATDDGIITRWNALNFDKMGTNDTHRGVVHCMRFHNGLQAMISGCSDKTVRQWRLGDDRMVGMSLYSDEVTCFADEEEVSAVRRADGFLPFSFQS